MSELTATWGPAAIASGFGTAQSIPGLIDWGLLGEQFVVSASRSSVVLTGAYNGLFLDITLEGRGFSFDGGPLSDGLVTSITISLSGAAADTSTILTLEADFEVRDFVDIIDAEQSGQDVSAIEDYFTAFDWTYEGLGGIDFLPSDAVSIDGVPIRLEGNDTITLGSSSDVWDGGRGNDRLSGGGGDDFLSGGQGRDQLFGGAGSDFLTGGGGSDRIVGGGGRDALIGGRGNDRLFGGGGSDSLVGNAGNDRLIGGGGGDFLDGGAGRDVLTGNRGADFMVGGAGADRLFGGAGGDVLIGGRGNDLLVGGAGNDELVSDGGNDRLRGGAGDDMFFIDAQNGANVIQDFNTERDTLVFFDALPGEDAFVESFAENGVVLGDASEIIQTFATVTDNGILLDMEQGTTVLLRGLDDLTALENAIDLYSVDILM